MTRKRFEIFGREIAIRPRDCAASDDPEGSMRPIVPAVTLYAQVTNDCPARCPFCSNAGNVGTPVAFDLPKLLDVLREIRYQGLELSRLCLTGGEPSAAPDLVEQILSALSEPEFADVCVQLSTNGVTDAARRLMAHPRWTSVVMSLHHYDLGRLRELYGLPFPIAPLDAQALSDPRVTVSCNLIRGYIDSSQEIGRMLAFVDRLGASGCGFVALRRVNDWCREHYVPSRRLSMSVVDRRLQPLNPVPNVIHLYSRRHGACCCCTNYLYAGERRTMPFYVRETFNSQYCESVLRYDGRTLCQGFGPEAVTIY